MTRHRHLHSALSTLLIFSALLIATTSEQNGSESGYGGIADWTTNMPSRLLSERHEQRLPHSGDYYRKQHRRGKPRVVRTIDISKRNVTSTSSSRRKKHSISIDGIYRNEITPMSRSTDKMARQQDSRRIKRLGSQYFRENYALMESMMESLNDHKESDSNSNNSDDGEIESDIGDGVTTTKNGEANRIDDDTDESSETTNSFDTTQKDDESPQNNDSNTTEEGSDNNIDNNEEDTKIETANKSDSSAPNDHTAGLNNDGINSGDTDQNEVENEEEDSFVNDQIVGGTKTEKNEFPFFGKFGDHSLFTCIYLYSPYSFFLASTYYI